MITATHRRPMYEWLLAIGVLALMLGGTAVSPVAAQTRKEAVTQANDYIATCFKTGGEPETKVSSDGTNIAVSCTSDGSTTLCVWDADLDYETNCGRVNNPNTHVPVDGGGVLDDGGADIGSTPNTHGDADAGSQPLVHHRHHHKHGHHRHHR